MFPSLTPGFHTAGRLLLFRVVGCPPSLLAAAAQIDAYRAGLPGQKFRARLVVVILPVGGSLDPYAEELYDLSERDICVSVGTVAFTELIAAARARAQSPAPLHMSRSG